MKNFTSIRNFLNTGVIGIIFVYFRNLALCSLMLAAGSYAIGNQPDWVVNIPADKYWGYILIGIGILLTFLNLADGLNKLFKLKFHLLINIIVSISYVVVSLRIVMMFWHFRIL
jgi:hypothetical protein